MMLMASSTESVSEKRLMSFSEIVPPSIRDCCINSFMFFQKLVPKLQAHPDVSQLSPVPDAYVPRLDLLIKVGGK